MRDAPPILVGVDAGATKSVALAVTPAGARVGRATGPGANPKRHGVAVAADRILALAMEAGGAKQTGNAGEAPSRTPALVFVAGAGIDRPEHARALERALGERLPATRILVVNDTLAVLRAATPDAVGLVVPVSTGGNVIGRATDGRVTDRGHGIFGGGYVLGAIAARAARRGEREAAAGLGEELRRAIRDADLGWLPDRPRRPAPEAALLGAAVVEAAERGDPLPARLVDRWCRRVAGAVREEVDRLGLGEAPAVVVYGGLGDASPRLLARIREAVLAAAPGARLVRLEVEPVEGAALLARDAWAATPIAWSFTPRR